MQHLAQVRRTGFQIFDLGLGILLGKIQHDIADAVRHGGRNAQAQRALLAGEAAGDLILGRLLDLAHTLGLLIEDHAGVGQLQPPGPSEEQAGAILLLHGLDLIAQGRLGDVEFPRSRRQAPLLHNGHIVEIVLQIHVSIPPNYRSISV